MEFDRPEKRRSGGFLRSGSRRGLVDQEHEKQGAGRSRLSGESVRVPCRSRSTCRRPGARTVAALRCGRGIG